jgi:hypothetical protein
MLTIAVKGTSNVLQLAVSIATSVPANNFVFSAIIVFLYSLVFVLSTISLILEYSHVHAMQEPRNAIANPSAPTEEPA